MKRRPAQVLTLKTLYDRCHEEGDCQLWTQSVSGRGVPYVWHCGKVVNARRLAHELRTGKPVQRHLVVRSTCGNSLCLEHAVPTTRAKIVADLAASGALSTPKARANRTKARRARSDVKHSIEVARIARQLRAEGMTLREIGDVIGEPNMTRVSVIVRGLAWRESVTGASVFSL